MIHSSFPNLQKFYSTVCRAVQEHPIACAIGAVALTGATTTAIIPIYKKIRDLSIGALILAYAKNETERRIIGAIPQSERYSVLQYAASLAPLGVPDLASIEEISKIPIDERQCIIQQTLSFTNAEKQAVPTNCLENVAETLARLYVLKILENIPAPERKSIIDLTNSFIPLGMINMDRARCLLIVSKIPEPERKLFEQQVLFYMTPEMDPESTIIILKELSALPADQRSVTNIPIRTHIYLLSLQKNLWSQSIRLVGNSSRDDRAAQPVSDLQSLVVPFDGSRCIDIGCRRGENSLPMQSNKFDMATVVLLWNIPFREREAFLSSLKDTIHPNELVVIGYSDNERYINIRALMETGFYNVRRTVCDLRRNRYVLVCSKPKI